MRHIHARLLAALVIAAFFGPLVVRGHTLFASDNRVEVGLRESPEQRTRSDHWDNDQVWVYVPEIHHQLRGQGSGWISTWNPHPEMGRPTAHVSGFSKAFFITHVLSWVTDDAFVVYTWLAILAVVLTAAFGLLLFEELDLHPAASLAGALGLSLGVFLVNRLDAVMWPWGVCWTVAILWLAASFLRRRSFGAAVGVALAVHALLLTAYPQQIVWHGYLVVGFVVLTAMRAPGDLRSRIVPVLQLAACAAVGLASVAPVYLDLALNAAESGRGAVDDKWFARRLPTISNIGDVTAFLAQYVDAFWLRRGPFNEFIKFNGSSLTPLYAVLIPLSLTGGLVRRLWPVHLFLAVCLLMSLWPAAYFLGLHYGGLNISRVLPLAAAFVPAAIASAYAADGILKGRIRAGWSTGTLAVLPWVLTLLGHRATGLALDPAGIAVSTALFLGAIAMLWWPRPMLVASMAAVTPFVYGYGLLVTRAPEEIQLTSPLVERVRAETQGDLRFAWVGEAGKDILPANQEPLYGLRSVHTYNSLSSTRYQEWTKRLCQDGARVYGRFFLVISSDSKLRGKDVALAGINVFVSEQPLDRRVARGRGRVGGLEISRPVRPPVLEGLAEVFEERRNGRVILAGPDALRPVTRVESLDDRIVFRVSPPADRESLLFVSQQYHPQWRARVDGQPARSVAINRFYQGVVVPPGSEVVELAFLPHVRWAWLPQVLFALAVMIVALRCLRPGSRSP